MDANKRPGKTKQLHYVNLPYSNCYLVDCPGYGFARVDLKEKESWGKLMQNYIFHSKSLRRMMILIDAKVGFGAMDKMLCDLLDQKEVPYIFVLTK
mmetsp:Transcript_19207/g.18866  ORF Transcript_19207/g.18866 Transcript_19207/m.18866 type:complete len:96 (-) Transcript_19207:90-377(-)